MKLLALLIGILIERLATQLFHWRRLRWIDRAIDYSFVQTRRLSGMPVWIGLLVATIVLVLPVLVLRLSLGDTLFGFPYLLLAVVVLFFSLGPSDIGEDVDEYCKAVEAENETRVRETAKALIERELPDDPEERITRVEESVCIQANNRLFAVIFWFVLFGPVGAWTYRVIDLIRRRAVFSASRTADNHDDGGNNDDGNSQTQSNDAVRIANAAEGLHGLLAWLPARLTAVGFALAGNFDGARTAWRRQSSYSASEMHEQSERLLADVGTAALALQPIEDETLTARAMRGATAATRLVYRLLLIWAAIIAVMTLYGLSL